MRLFLCSSLLILSSLSAQESNYYQPFSTTANPLYSPWLKEEIFKEFYNRLPSKNSQTIYKRYLQYVLAKNSLANCDGGDLLEVGVCEGSGLDMIASVVDRFDDYYRKVYGVDSFAGISAPCEYDNEIGKNKSFFKKGDIKGSTLDEIQKRMNYHRCSIQLYKGWIPEPFSNLYYCEFCFAHIDVALYQPTKDSLEFIYSRMVPNGIILFDDYGFPMCPGARKAIDDFLVNKGETIIPFPSGQAMLIKKT